MIHPLIRRAQQRRRNNGEWVVSLVVDGYDDPFEYVVAGSLSQEVAGHYAKYFCFRDLRKEDHSLRFEMVTVQSILRDGIEKQGSR